MSLVTRYRVQESPSQTHKRPVNGFLTLAAVNAVKTIIDKRDVYAPRYYAGIKRI